MNEENDNIYEKNKNKKDNEKELEKEKEKEKNEKEKKKNENAKSIINCNFENFMKKTCKFGIEYGFVESVKSIVIPKLIDILLNWFKKILKEKLLPQLLNRFDECFEKLGTHVIILQERYNIKDYMETFIKRIKYFFKIIIGIQIYVTPILKKAINNIKSGVESHEIISQFTEGLISITETKIIIPIKQFIDNIFGNNEKIQKFEFFEKIIEEGYKKVRNIGIKKYENIKDLAIKKKEQYKQNYLDKKKEICDLPDDLVKKYQEKKEELKKKYENLKKDIIDSTDQKIEYLKKINLTKEFQNIMKNLELVINKKLNEIKEKAKNKIDIISLKIPNFFNIFINFIDDILKLNFGTYDEYKIDILEHINTFILEVESGNIDLKQKNENGDEIDKDIKELLINHLNQRLNIKSTKISEIIEYLYKNRLNALINKRINIIISYGQKKFNIIKKYYEPILNIIKEYFSILKQNAVEIIGDCKSTINNGIDSLFEYFINYINSILNKANVLDFYLKKLDKDITISKDFKNNLLETIKSLKEKSISELSIKFENEMKELEKKLDEKVEKIKEKSNKEINKLVDKYENKIFGKINNIIKNVGEEEKMTKEDDTKKDNHKKDKNNKIKKEINIEKEKKENKKNKENNNKGNEKKDPSEFEKFDNKVNKIGKIIDNKICGQSLKIEEKLINIVKNSQAREYLKMRFSEDVEKKKFDDFFKSIENAKNKGKKYLESDKIKNKCKKLDLCLEKIKNSKIEKTINFIDGFNVKKANTIVDEINNILPLLDSTRKEDFRDNAKKLIEDYIYKCYENYLEPKIKELVIGLSKELIDTIQKNRNKKKKSNK